MLYGEISGYGWLDAVSLNVRRDPSKGPKISLQRSQTRELSLPIYWTDTPGYHRQTPGYHWQAPATSNGYFWLPRCRKCRTLKPHLTVAPQLRTLQLRHRHHHFSGLSPLEKSFFGGTPPQNTGQLPATGDGSQRGSRSKDYEVHSNKATCGGLDHVADLCSCQHITCKHYSAGRKYTRNSQTNVGKFGGSVNS